MVVKVQGTVLSSESRLLLERVFNEEKDLATMAHSLTARLDGSLLLIWLACFSMAHLGSSQWMAEEYVREPGRSDQFITVSSELLVSNSRTHHCDFLLVAWLAIHPISVGPPGIHVAIFCHESSKLALRRTDRVASEG
ncbi:hypothetical protein VNO77_27041 [Canavalia gladiata]|uniref:Uncharacterized protein n=1 Tax=Canavalia gladiata TaxID=3824 RepID=A0AAN9KU26_CANGL